MKRFRFRLQTVLNHRAILEERAGQVFAALQQQLTACDMRIARLKKEYADAVADRQAHFDPIDIHYREKYLDGLLSLREQEERQREGIQARLSDAREALVAAKQEREAIERIRDREYDAYLAEVHHVEQERLDEMATMQHIRTHLQDAA